MNRWYRAYVGTCSDPKISAIAHASGASKCEVIAMWHFILEQCANANNGGKFKLDAHLVCGTLGVTVDNVKNIWAGMIVYEMVTDKEVLAWKKRQYEIDSSDPTNNIRQKRWREKHLRNGRITALKRTETETETETETYKKDISVDTEIEVKPPKERKRTSNEGDEDFERFWKSYPKRKGSNPKQLAKVKFLSAVHKGVSASDLVAAAGAYADEQQSLGKVGTEFVAQASTWLNQQRYFDYRKVNGHNGAPPGLNPEQKMAWVQEEMRKFREAKRKAESEGVSYEE